jgi:hypothetical protein
MFHHIKVHHQEGIFLAKANNFIDSAFYCSKPIVVRPLLSLNGGEARLPDVVSETTGFTPKPYAPLHEGNSGYSLYYDGRDQPAPLAPALAQQSYRRPDTNVHQTFFKTRTVAAALFYRKNSRVLFIAPGREQVFHPTEKELTRLRRKQVVSSPASGDVDHPKNF